MATPRKHWFRVFDSILWEGWTDGEVATMVRLSAYLNTRWARDGKSPENAGRVTLDLAACRLIARRTHRADCERALRALGARLTLSVVSVGECFEIEWPKWPESQGIITRESPESRPRVAPSGTPPQDSPARRKTQDSGRISEAPSAPPAPRASTRPRRARSVTPCPERLEPEQRDRIRAWATEQGIDPSKLGAEWEAMRDHFVAKGESRADWPATFRTWLRNAQRFAARDRVTATGERESAAQAKLRRTKEAMVEAYRRSTGGDDSPPPLIALSGGRES